MCKKIINVIAFLLLPALMTSLCSAAIEPITSVTTDNPDGTIPYNLLSITVGDYTVNADRLVVGTTTVGLTGGGAPWPEMDNLDIMPPEYVPHGLFGGSGKIKPEIRDPHTPGPVDMHIVNHLIFLLPGHPAGDDNNIVLFSQLS